MRRDDFYLCFHPTCRQQLRAAGTRERLCCQGANVDMPARFGESDKYEQLPIAYALVSLGAARRKFKDYANRLSISIMANMSPWL